MSPLPPHNPACIACLDKSRELANVSGIMGMVTANVNKLIKHQVDQQLMLGQLIPKIDKICTQIENQDDRLKSAEDTIKEGKIMATTTVKISRIWWIGIAAILAGVSGIITFAMKVFHK